MKTSTILKRAVKLIEKPENWIKRGFTDGREAFCAVGAILQTMHRGLKSDLFREEHCKRVSEMFGFHQALWPFNDSPSTTHEDILTAFALAIAVAESEGN